MLPSFAQPSSIGNRYTVLQRLGGGAMGAVFLALDTHRNNERVAIKVPATSRHWQDEYKRRVVKEISILSALQHPNIIEIHDWGQDPQVGPYIVMEYIAGGSVRQLMAQYPGERLDPREAIRIAAAVADALAYAHARPQPIIHRDIKPDNILMRHSDGLVKISDFGLAAMLQGRRAQTQWGTPDYIAPEQALGKGADARSDLYALAATLFHMLTGIRPPSLGQPLPGRPSALMLPGVLHPDQARRLDYLIITLLAYDPDQRRPAPNRMPWRASEVAEELRAILERRPANAYPLPEDSAIFPALLTGLVPPVGAPQPVQTPRPQPPAAPPAWRPVVQVPPMPPQMVPGQPVPQGPSLAAPQPVPPIPPMQPVPPLAVPQPVPPLPQAEQIAPVQPPRPSEVLPAPPPALRPSDGLPGQAFVASPVPPGGGVLPAAPGGAAGRFSALEKEAIVGLLVGMGGIIALSVVVPVLSDAGELLRALMNELLIGLLLWGVGLIAGLASPRGRQGRFPWLALLVTALTVVIGFPLVQTITEVVRGQPALSGLGEVLRLLLVSPFLCLGTIGAWLVIRALGR